MARKNEGLYLANDSGEPPPEPLVPLRNIGTILDSEIPVRVRKELKRIGFAFLRGLGKALLLILPSVAGFIAWSVR